MHATCQSLVLVLSLLVPPCLVLAQQQPQKREEPQQKPEEKKQPPEQEPKSPPEHQPNYIDPNKTGGAHEVRVSLDEKFTLTSLHAGDELTGKVDRGVRIGSQKIPRGARAQIAVVAEPETKSLELRLLSLEFRGRTYRPDAEKGLAMVESATTNLPTGVIDPRASIAEGPMAGIDRETMTIRKVSFQVRAVPESQKSGPN